MDVTLYDTTLRDGTQREGLSLSAEDKVKIARRLDALGVSYIEGGWPGRASVTLRVGGAEIGAAADGAGPVNALDRAVREALLPHYPELADVHLVDYRVRIVDEHLGTAAKPRVVIESARGAERWSTVGCSENIIEASWQALRDSLELALWRRG